MLDWLFSPQISGLVVNILEQGYLFGFLGLGVLITFRFFRFPDLTAEGSYPLGGSVVAILLVSNVNPFVATAIAALAGALAGSATALIHTRLKINNIISGIIVMTAIYSVNLRVMGRANIPLLASRSVFGDVGDWLGAVWFPMQSGAMVNIAFLLVLLALVSVALI